MSEYSIPTEQQYLAIGRVAAIWSHVEFMLEGIIARLTMAADFPALALTNGLSIDNRLEALHNLVVIHRVRYGGKVVAHDLLDELEKVPAEIKKVKNRRNQIVHYVWFRQSDEKLFGTRFKGKQALDTPQSIKARVKAHESGAEEFEDGPSLVTTKTNLNRFADKLQAMADRLFGLQQRLTEIDEEWIAKAIIRGKTKRV